MSGVIEKIGEFFAQREREQQQAVAFVASQGPIPPTALTSTGRNGGRELQKASEDAHHSPVVFRRRLSSPTPAKDYLRNQITPRSESLATNRTSAVPPLPRALRPFLSPTHYKDGGSDDGVVSSVTRRPATPLKSNCSHLQMEKPNHEILKDEQKTPVKQRKKRAKKRKSSTSVKTEEEKQASEKLAQLLKSERIANGLARAQERARRILDEQQQQNRARRQAQREAVEKIKAQLDRIEQIRASQSLTRSLSSACSVTSSTLSSCESFLSEDSQTSSSSSLPHSTSSTLRTLNGLSQTLDQATSEGDGRSMGVLSTKGRDKLICDHRPNLSSEPRYLDALEQRTKEQMILQLQFRKRCLDTKKHQEQLQQQLARIACANANKQAQVEKLEQSKADIEKELARIVDELNGMRKRRHQLEEAGREDRQQRQKEAERALQRRLREEEWVKLMEEEKARSVVAAGAREKAGERVQQARMTQKQRASRKAQQLTPRAMKSGRRVSSGLALIASLPPELAEFEEEGLYAGESLDHTNKYRCEEPSAPNNQKEDEDNRACTPIFEWHVPSYTANQDTFSSILFAEIVSDDDE